MIRDSIPFEQGKVQKDKYLINKLHQFIVEANYVGINHEMLIFQSRWSDHDKQRRGDGNADNDPTRDYYLSWLILGSIRLFCSNLIMDKLVFCPILVRENKQFRKWPVCHWLPGIFVSILQIIGFVAYILVLHSQARLCLLVRRKLQSLLRDHAVCVSVAAQ